MPKLTIYILELENEKYYVGRSTCSKGRILQHFNNNGSEWTKLYKPIRVISQIKTNDTFDEEKHTLLTMDKYGIDNVRGGSYCTIELSKNDKKKALQTIASVMDRCYKCGKTGHFANECPKQNNVNKILTEFNNKFNKYNCEECGDHPVNCICWINECFNCHKLKCICIECCYCHDKIYDKHNCAFNVDTNDEQFKTLFNNIFQLNFTEMNDYYALSDEEYFAKNKMSKNDIDELFDNHEHLHLFKINLNYDDVQRYSKMTNDVNIPKICEIRMSFDVNLNNITEIKEYNNINENLFDMLSILLKYSKIEFFLSVSKDTTIYNIDFIGAYIVVINKEDLSIYESLKDEIRNNEEIGEEIHRGVLYNEENKNPQCDECGDSGFQWTGCMCFFCHCQTCKKRYETCNCIECETCEQKILNNKYDKHKLICCRWCKREIEDANSHECIIFLMQFDWDNLFSKFMRYIDKLNNYNCIINSDGDKNLQIDMNYKTIKEILLNIINDTIAFNDDGYDYGHVVIKTFTNLNNIFELNSVEMPRHESNFSKGTISEKEILMLLKHIEEIRSITTECVKCVINVIQAVEQPENKCSQTTSNLNNLKVVELRQKCKEFGICKYSKMNKSELINALELINVTSE